jgi:hypothetical protein
MLVTVFLIFSRNVLHTVIVDIVKSVDAKHSWIQVLTMNDWYSWINCRHDWMCSNVLGSVLRSHILHIVFYVKWIPSQYLLIRAFTTDIERKWNRLCRKVFRRRFGMFLKKRDISWDCIMGLLKITGCLVISTYGDVSVTSAALIAGGDTTTVS